MFISIFSTRCYGGFLPLNEVEDNWVLKWGTWGKELVARLCIGLETKIDHEGVFLIFVFGEERIVACVVSGFLSLNGLWDRRQMSSKRGGVVAWVISGEF